MAYNQMVAYGRDGRGGGGHGGGHDRDRDGRGGRRRGWGWSDWNDWGFFWLPYPYPVYPQPLVYAAPQVLSPYPASAPVMVVGADSSLAGPAGVITPLGFKPRKIRKHKTRTVIARPQVPFQPSTLYIPREVAKHFEICSVRVGQVLVLGSRDPIPAEMYSNEGSGPAAIQLPPLIPGQHVYLTVRNHSSHSHRYRAALNGISLF